MQEPKIVDSITFEIQIDIIEWETADGTRYEWVTSDASEESFSLFDTADEAIADARRHF